jgi:M3 family oligoendopeptidase
MAAPNPTLQRPENLTAELVQATFDALLTELKAMPDEPADWEQFFLRWNAFKKVLAGEASRRHYREAQNTQDAVAEEAVRYFREQIQPIAEVVNAKVREILLASRHRPHLEARFGALLFRYFELEQESFAAVNIPLIVEEGEIQADYQKTLGAAQIRVGDQTLTLPRALALTADPDEAVRKEAWLAVGRWVQSKSPELHGYYSELVERRHQRAQNLGEATFIPMGYRGMFRTDYGPAEAAAFREGILRHVVPLAAKIRRMQAEALGAATVKPWNMGYFPGFSLAPDVAPVETQLSNAATLFARLHPTLLGHFQRMVEGKLIDLENRPGKQPGAFCTTFDDEGLVAILCNSTGASKDIGTLIHEMGHAFQAWESGWIEPLELRWPTSDAAEIHSMGMEFLSLPEIEAFFTPEDAAKFRRLKLIDTVVLLPYIATVDAFQHWIYANPENTPEERDDEWCRLWDLFMVGVDWEGFEEFQAVRWKYQAHIFEAPFYYIDYGIAESGAMQLWRKALDDRERTMEIYLKLCRIGGTQSVLEIFRSGEMQSPFDPDVFQPLMAAVATELGL